MSRVNTKLIDKKRPINIGTGTGATFPDEMRLPVYQNPSIPEPVQKPSVPNTGMPLPKQTMPVITEPIVPPKPDKPTLADLTNPVTSTPNNGNGTSLQWNPLDGIGGLRDTTPQNPANTDAYKELNSTDITEPPNQSIEELKKQLEEEKLKKAIDLLKRNSTYLQRSFVDRFGGWILFGSAFFIAWQLVIQTYQVGFIPSAREIVIDLENVTGIRKEGSPLIVPQGSTIAQLNNNAIGSTNPTGSNLLSDISKSTGTAAAEIAKGFSSIGTEAVKQAGTFLVSSNNIMTNLIADVYRQGTKSALELLVYWNKEFNEALKAIAVEAYQTGALSIAYEQSRLAIASVLTYVFVTIPEQELERLRIQAENLENYNEIVEQIVTSIRNDPRISATERSLEETNQKLGELSQEIRNFDRESVTKEELDHQLDTLRRTLLEADQNTKKTILQTIKESNAPMITERRSLLERAYQEMREQKESVVVSKMKEYFERLKVTLGQVTDYIYGLVSQIADTYEKIRKERSKRKSYEPVPTEEPSEITLPKELEEKFDESLIVDLPKPDTVELKKLIEQILRDDPEMHQRFPWIFDSNSNINRNLFSKVKELMELRERNRKGLTVKINWIEEVKTVMQAIIDAGLNTTKTNKSKVKELFRDGMKFLKQAEKEIELPESNIIQMNDSEREKEAEQELVNIVQRAIDNYDQNDTEYTDVQQLVNEYTNLIAGLEGPVRQAKIEDFTKELWNLDYVKDLETARRRTIMEEIGIPEKQIEELLGPESFLQGFITNIPIEERVKNLRFILNDWWNKNKEAIQKQEILEEMVGDHSDEYQNSGVIDTAKKMVTAPFDKLFGNIK